MKTLKMLSPKGDELLASWINTEVAGFLAAQEVVRQKIREGYALVDIEENPPKVVKELSDADHMLVPQIQAKKFNVANVFPRLKGSGFGGRRIDDMGIIQEEFLNMIIERSRIPEALL